MKRLLYKGTERRLHKDAANQLTSGLAALVARGDINLSPSYQRGLVWTAEQRELLIDSLWYGISMPALIFREMGWGQTPWLEVVDGKQRLDTICGFLGDRYRYDGKLLSELPEAWRRTFRTVCVPVVTVSDLSDTDTIELYDRINFCGTPHRAEDRQ